MAGAGGHWRAPYGTGAATVWGMGFGPGRRFRRRHTRPRQENKKKKIAAPSIQRGREEHGMLPRCYPDVTQMLPGPC